MLTENDEVILLSLLFDRDNWDTGYENLLVRQARPYAGDTYGLHLPLLAG
ncbi:hypothetical protein QQF54_00220 [Lelliottia sp. V106_10]|nr:MULTISPECIES: hypothetical protein [unclassified Lelliottia]MDK9355125.1 hypothetical protein [Lelliottia sp. V106_16]MDK9371793.1 hypothetical protein [Lelliottia sp. V106_10]MDK9598970.1 hypothetical protein [Lelliottia sp. V106_5]